MSEKNKNEGQKVAVILKKDSRLNKNLPVQR